MPKLKILSGSEVIKVFASLGFKIVAQRGSHIKLRRLNEKGISETLTIPNHPELDKGTLRAIYRQALQYVAEKELASYFYHD